MKNVIYIYIHTHTNICHQPAEYSDVLQSGVPVIKWHQFVEDDIQSETTPQVPF